MVIGPFQKFFQLSASGAILLLLAALTAFLLANSPLAGGYNQFWNTPISIAFGPFSSAHSLHFWINDGLMAIFFFVVGLEIKRELLVGELSTRKQAMFPIMAAIGGMLLPGLIFSAFNPPGSAYFTGWGIPTVTDIAFAIGVLALLGDRVPLGLKVFLTALAIIDDLGAVLIIALFYSHAIEWHYIILSIALIGVLMLMNRSGARQLLYYAILGVALWYAMLMSGVHPTLAGVLLAFTIPANSKIRADQFCEDGVSTFNRIATTCSRIEDCSILSEKDYQESVQHIETLCEEAQSPLQRLEHSLGPWVTYFIMPVFALANASVSIGSYHLTDALLHPVTLGILLGLIFGKQLGITAFAWLSVRLGWTTLPVGISWAQVYGASCLGGIGFTMSIFITNLAFAEPELISAAKIGILLASLLSGILGCLALWRFLPKRSQNTETIV
ncbi:MAG: Na+/H+ antiporter NhaA [Vampirovibrionales bacterium]|nr:Na+/H+ antiporter NhaA [Vampirovibrionales bacterium]